MVIRHQYKAKYENPRASLTAYEETLVFCNWAETAKKQALNLVRRVEELKRKVKSQLWQVCYGKVRALVGKEWDGDMRLIY